MPKYDIGELIATLNEAVNKLNNLRAKHDDLEKENARLREALEGIKEYWNGAQESAVDAAEECRDRALAALSDNNGWPGKPGVPMNPERDGWHWRKSSKVGSKPGATWWCASERVWQDEMTYVTVGIASQHYYLGPCFTPAEVDARIATARKDGMKDAAKRLEELHKNHNYDPESGTLTKKLGRYDKWPESAKAAKLEHDTGYYRAIAEGVAHILALAKGEGDE